MVLCKLFSAGKTDGYKIMFTIVYYLFKKGINCNLFQLNINEMFWLIHLFSKEKKCNKNVNLDCEIIIILLLVGFSLEFWLKSDWQQFIHVSRTLRSIEDHLSRVIVGMVSIFLLISSFPCCFSRSFSNILSAPVTISIFATFMFRSFFSCMAKFN